MDFKPQKVKMPKGAKSSDGTALERLARGVFSNGYAFGSLSVPETALTTVSKGN